MVHLQRNGLLRVPGDRYLGHRADPLRIARRGFYIKGKNELKKLHPSFLFQPAIGAGPGQYPFVDTLCLSTDRYRNLESARPGASLVYTAEGGVHKSSRVLIKDQNPDTKRNKALKRSAAAGAPHVQVWFGVPPRSRGSVHGPHRGCSTYTYYGLYKISDWQENIDAATGFRYYTVQLRRKADEENTLWFDHEIVF